MGGEASAKICVVCKQDCSKRPRQKDAEGNYTCQDCVNKAAKSTSKGPPGKPAAKPGQQPKPAETDAGLAVAFAGLDQSSLVPCPGCGVLLKPGSVICTSCGFDLEKGRSVRTRVEIQTSSAKGAVKAGRIALAAGTTAMLPVFWIVGSAVGGAIGAAIWAVVAATTGFEVGYIAVLVGILAGIGAGVGNGGRGGVMPGLVAAVVSIASIFAGKYAAASYVMDKEITKHRAEFVAVTDDEVMVEVAKEIADKQEEAGTKLAWPGGERPEFFDDLSEFPPAVAQEAKAKWASGTEDWKKEHRDRMSRQKDTHLEENRDVIRGVGFLASFSLYDLLWIVLATGAAFKAGSHGGTGGSEE